MGPSNKSKKQRARKRQRIIIVMMITLVLALAAVLLTQQSNTGGGGGGGGSMQAPAKEAALPTPQAKGAALPAPRAKAPKPQDQAKPAASAPTLGRIVWSAYDDRIYVATFRVVIRDGEGQVVFQKDLPVRVHSLDLREVPGLKENHRYRYQIIPLGLNESSLKAKLDTLGINVQNGRFYVDFANEAPDTPRILYPRAGQVVNSKNPVIKWQGIKDPDPNDTVTCKVHLRLPGGKTLSYDAKPPASGRPWSLEIPHRLEENQAYRVWVVARDNKGASTQSQKVKFYVDTVSDRPSKVSGLGMHKKTGPNGFSLSWSTSREPNPKARITGYEVVVQDVKSGEETIYPAKRNSLWFNRGEEGATYRFKVRAKSSRGKFSRFSAWSQGFAYAFINYQPRIITPQQDGQKLHFGDTLAWNPGKDVLRYVVSLDGINLPPIKTASIKVAGLFKEIKPKFGTKYLVQVIGVLPGGQMSKGSAERSFILVQGPPSTPVGLNFNLPAKKSDTLSKQHSLTWQASSDPEGGPLTYIVEISASADFAQPVIIHRTDKTTLTLGEIWQKVNKLEDGYYNVRVIAEDDQGKRSIPSKPLSVYFNIPFFG